ncbi:hypothetical protein [Maledivibacter halophilus]|uniref:Transporter n=1 Tax=Maledivibacter halophilus TaxID=36842 RepID=A0A1T5M8M6_9FIRM|nr:hypothetical protein [Maledivibacter halophilus]SKC84168.1 hypothetical protein SAMN02194393_04023 [Maledivibacter halophilus]
MLYRFPRPPFGGPPFLFQPGPTFRPPIGGPGMPPVGPGGPSDASMPPGRPPSYTPERAPGIRAVDPGAIRRCRYRYTYLWLENGQEFWSYLTYVGRRSVSGFRWIGFRWVYFGTDLRNIESFICQ